MICLKKLIHVIFKFEPNYQPSSSAKAKEMLEKHGSNMEFGLAVKSIELLEWHSRN